MEAILEEYNATMIPLAADYYQVTTGWAEARTNWWNMLQDIGEGGDVTQLVDGFVTTANAAARK